MLTLLFFSSLLGAAEGEFYINAEGVKKISMSLPVRAIDFGDIYRDMDVTSERVNFSVNAESDYWYRVEISNDEGTGAIQISRSAYGVYTADRITFNELGTGDEQQFEFYVGLNSKKIRGDLSARITVLVAYNDIAE